MSWFSEEIDSSKKKQRVQLFSGKSPPITWCNNDRACESRWFCSSRFHICSAQEPPPTESTLYTLQTQRVVCNSPGHTARIKFCRHIDLSWKISRPHIVSPAYERFIDSSQSHLSDATSKSQSVPQSAASFAAWGFLRGRPRFLGWGIGPSASSPSAAPLLRERPRCFGLGTTVNGLTLWRT